jgi:hypothetical protein
MRNLQDVLTNDYGLHLTGWELNEATGISSDAKVIVGFGVNASGQYEAWRAVIPEPSTLLMLLTGGLFLTAAAWRRGRRVGIRCDNSCRASV